MNCLIVMQGETYEEERKQSILQTSVFDRAGSHHFSWENMKDLQLNDVVFHYVKGAIVAVSVVQETTRIVTDPHGQKQYVAKTDYTDLERPLLIAPIFHEILPLLQEKYAPFQQDGSGNSGYLFPIHAELALLLLSHLEESVEDQVIQPTLLEETSALTIRLLRNIHSWQQTLHAQEQQRLQLRRADMLHHHGAHCAVCEVAVASLLDVPFLKAPEKCTSTERYAIDNGLVLCHNHAALYTSGLIAINAKGQLCVSDQLMNDQYTLGLYEGQQIPVLKSQKKYLNWHMNQVFQTL